MKLDRTPWVRQRMTDEDVQELRTALPDDYAMSMSARSPHGPFSVLITRDRQPIASASGLSPVEAGAKALGEVER